MNIAQATFLIFSAFALLTVAAQDSDGDGIPDTFEITFGLNPADPLDAATDPDSDNVSNFDEFQQNTDPVNPDTDLDGVGDQTDPSPLDRAVQYWGAPLLTSGDDLNYVWPTWFNGAGKNGGIWTNQSWLASDSLPGTNESLFLLYDNSVVTNDLLATVDFFDHPGGGLHISLLDAGMNFLAFDVAGNLHAGSGVVASREILIPATAFPAASIVAIHRSAGTTEVFQSTLQFVETTDLSPTDPPPAFPNYTAYTYCDAIGPFIRLIPNNPADPSMDIDLSYNPYTPVGTITLCQNDSDQDGLPNLWEIANGTDPAIADCVQIIGESGTLSVSQLSRTVWHNLVFSRSYNQPVVFMQSPSANDPDPVVVRTRNTTPTGCEFQLSEWNYQDGIHGEETLSFVVVEAGVHVLPDGTILEAGEVMAGKNNRTFTLQAAFPATPTLITQLSSHIDPLPVTVRQRNASTNSFQCKIQLEQALSATNHADEAVSYLAVTPGISSNFGKQIEAGQTADVVRHVPHTLNFAAPFASAPVFLSNMATTDGGDPAASRLSVVNSSGATIYVDE